MDDDAGIGRKGGDRKDFVEIDIASEFDTFVHELFETEPPLGQYMMFVNIILVLTGYNNSL